MQRTFFLSLFIMLVAGAACAQITIGPGDFPTPGTLCTSHDLYNVALNPGSPGGNQSYTMPSSGSWQTRLSYIVAPASTPYGYLFPTATFCQLHADQYNEYEYYRVAANGLFLLASIQEGQQDTSMMIPEQEALLAPLPCTYGANYARVMRVTTELYPGMTMHMIDSTAVAVDGWGTMTTDFGTWAVLRFSEHNYSIIDTNGHVVDTQEEWGYSYHSQDAYQGVEISDEPNGSNPNFTQGNIYVTTLSQLQADPVRGPVAERFTVGQNYPNPFNPTTVLPIEMEHTGNVTVSIYDETGRLVYTLNAELSAGSHRLPIDGSQWATGTYFAQVTEGVRSMTQKMLLMK